MAMEVPVISGPLFLDVFGNKVMQKTNKICLIQIFRLRIIGKQASRREAPIIVCAPHKSCLDALVGNIDKIQNT